VSSSYKAPFAFTGGTIAQVNVDVSGRPYVDLEREFARAFAKD
jgi:imidazoleglycerol phosphate dehydratase HisB